MPNRIAHPPVKEWGADAAMEKRPGVPMEKETGVTPQAWERQPARYTVIHKRMDLEELTPVFGTNQPPHGLSGMIRRAAYALPDNRAQHWMLLMMGDRVDVLESHIAEIFAKPSAALFITLGAAAAAIAFFHRSSRRSLIPSFLK